MSITYAEVNNEKRWGRPPGFSGLPSALLPTSRLDHGTQDPELAAIEYCRSSRPFTRVSPRSHAWPGSPASRGCHGFALARGRSTRVRKPASFRDFTSPIPGISRFQGGGPRANLTLTRLEWNRWCVLFLQTRSADRRAASDAHPDRGGSLERCGRSAQRGLGCVGGWRAWPPVSTSARLRDARRWLEDFPRFDMGLRLIVRAGLRS